MSGVHRRCRWGFRGLARKEAPVSIPSEEEPGGTRRKGVWSVVAPGREGIDVCFVPSVRSTPGKRHL